MVRSGFVLGLAGIALWACARGEQTVTGPPCVSLQVDLDSALSVQGRHVMELMAIPGVVGTGVGVTTDCRPVIRVFAREAGVIGVPSILEGIPVEVEVTGAIVAQSS